MKYFYYYFQRVLRNSLDLDPNPYSGDFWIWIEIFGWIRVRGKKIRIQNTAVHCAVQTVHMARDLISKDMH